MDFSKFLGLVIVDSFMASHTKALEVVGPVFPRLMTGVIALVMNNETIFQLPAASFTGVVPFL